MDITQIKHLKEHTEQGIHNLLKQFMDETGTLIYDIDYDMEIYRSIGGQMKDIAFKVELDVRV